jgi:phosphatidate cytidylyltransferase
MNDIAGYVVGNIAGKHKFGTMSLFSNSALRYISPNKSIEGTVAGILFSTLLSFILTKQFNSLYHSMSPDVSITYSLIYGIVVSVLGLVGDLTASLIKRNLSIKDFGDLLPGHGGVLDRIDSYILIAPISYLFYKYVYNSVSVEVEMMGEYLTRGFNYFNNAFKKI